MPKTIHSASEGQKFASDASLTVVSCATCHMTYAIPSTLKASALAYPGDSSNGWVLFCPLGHEWHYVGESVEDKLERERERAARLAAQRDQARARANDTEARRVAQKAATTRVRKQRDRERARVAAGVCPCCNRTFQNLARHMEGQHPEYGPLHENDGAEASRA